MEIYDIISDLDFEHDVFIELFSYTQKGLEKNPVFYNEVVNKGYFYAI